ncbi:hypothetical protein CR513_12075, partial [Mucuna pruriens]
MSKRNKVLQHNGNHIQTKANATDIPRSSWNEEQKMRQWRPQVTTLKASKDLKKLPMEELLITLKIFTKETKEKSQVVCYECKKAGHFNFECPSVKKEKNLFFKKNKGLMETWEDLDLSSSKEKDKEAISALWMI